jgi:hypothetical protein
MASSFSYSILLLTMLKSHLLCIDHHHRGHKKPTGLHLYNSNQYQKVNGQKAVRNMFKENSNLVPSMPHLSSSQPIKYAKRNSFMRVWKRKKKSSSIGEAVD